MKKYIVFSSQKFNSGGIFTKIHMLRLIFVGKESKCVPIRESILIFMAFNHGLFMLFFISYHCVSCMMRREKYL